VDKFINILVEGAYKYERGPVLVTKEYVRECLEKSVVVSRPIYTSNPLKELNSLQISKYIRENV
jgi:hypothetical protein